MRAGKVLTLTAMHYVLTVDQRHSRRDSDHVDDALRLLDAVVGAVALPFERTAGDEFQGLLKDAAQTVDAVLALLRAGGWSIGLGVGTVAEPLPVSTRAGRGSAFERARDALIVAKHRPHHVAVVGTEQRGHDADVLLTFLAAVRSRRTELGWQAVDMMEAGHSLAETARRLGVSRQAVGQRLAAALWHQERDVRPLVIRLIEQAA